MRSKLLMSLGLLISNIMIAQSNLEVLNFLIGSWQGVESGMAGDGIGFRTYTYQLDRNFIQVKNQSTFPNSERKPKGEVHRDLGMFSYNRNSEEIIYRSYNVEGFVNIFVLSKDVSDENKMVFLTREIENNPGGWKARLLLEKLSDDEFSESFDIAMDGSTFNNVLSNHWYRIE